MSSPSPLSDDSLSDEPLSELPLSEFPPEPLSDEPLSELPPDELPLSVLLPPDEPLSGGAMYELLLSDEAPEVLSVPAVG